MEKKGTARTTYCNICTQKNTLGLHTPTFCGVNPPQKRNPNDCGEVPKRVHTFTGTPPVLKRPRYWSQKQKTRKGEGEGLGGVRVRVGEEPTETSVGGPRPPTWWETSVGPNPKKMGQEGKKGPPWPQGGWNVSLATTASVPNKQDRRGAPPPKCVGNPTSV